MTLSLLRILADRRIQIIGQHEDIVVIRIDGTLNRLDTMDLGVPLGLEEDIAVFCATAELELHLGDLLLLHTDGISEAENTQGEQYGLERLIELAIALRESSALEIKRAALLDLARFIGEQTVFDDITLVVIKRC